MSESDDEAAEAYYEAAQRRFGFLGTSLVDIQCFYYASLFERYAFRPLQAWMYLQQAATRLRVHNMQRHGQENRLRMGGQGDYPVESESTGAGSAISYHLEQRAFWTIHKAERYLYLDRTTVDLLLIVQFRLANCAIHDTSREFATALGITLASDLTGFKSPTAFPTPPESLNNLTPGDDGDMSDVFSPRRNEFIWFFYLAEISLRRTLDEVLSVIYEKGEQSWIENIDLVCRQYYESEKQISDLCVYHLLVRESPRS